MYKKKLFESMEFLLEWMNERDISHVDIITIMPFQTEQSDGKSQLHREYEVVYKERSRSRYI